MTGRLSPILLFFAALTPFAYPDAPPTAHTGGFGEPTCHRCHFDAPLDAPGGTLSLDGLPPKLEAGRRYRLTLTLARAGMQSAGFQLSARTADGRSAGRLEALGASVSVVRDDSTGIVYAQHTEAGTALAAPDTARWTFAWTPSDTAAAVFHAAANATNDDASEFGDFVYLLARPTGLRGRAWEQGRKEE